MANNLCHFELMTNNPEKCKAFYGKVFDWQFDDQAMPGYTLVRTGTDPSGGIFLKPPEAPGVCLNVYFHVDDIDATLAKVSAAGGTVHVPKMSIPNVGEMGVFGDPEGITVCVFKPQAS
ncbi:MAG: VOC family protein [Planctomycetota bacterium]